LKELLNYICLSKHIVRKIIMKIDSEYNYTTNSYPQECESGEWLSDVKVWKHSHRERTLQTLTSCALRWWKLTY
jgi:hypothetical protein